jgi:hypothetical protein
MPLSLRSSRPLANAVVALAALAATGLTATVSSAAPPAAAPATQVVHDQVCGAPTGHRTAACLAVLDRDTEGRPLSPTAAAAAGIHPFMAADLQDAYNLPSDLLGARQTIAIVDAFDNPDAEADLAVYRAENGLPPCTTDNGCLRKVDQRGGTNYPRGDVGWGLEIALDLDMASAACPNCNLLLVEADDNDIENLGLAVDRAVALGADAISNSYGAGEYNEELGIAAHYNHPGVPILASSGDGGFGTLVPAALSTVIAVGGTSLFPDSGPRGWKETAWAGAGSGCSAYVAKPAWQRDRLCDRRTVADVAAVADPATPVAVYDTFGQPGWLTVGGTSASAPLLAGVYALAGNAAVIDPGAYLYAHSGALFDVTAGSTGTCGGSYLCTAGRGYDGPTGLGTPNGIGAF